MSTDCTNDAICKCAFRNSMTNDTERPVQKRPRLTPRQRETLLAWLRYGTKDAVAQHLFVTPSTVKTHIQRVRELYSGVGRPASSKVALFIRAVQDGVIDITDDELLHGFLAESDDE